MHAETPMLAASDRMRKLFGDGLMKQEGLGELLSTPGTISSMSVTASYAPLVAVSCLLKKSGKESHHSIQALQTPSQDGHMRSVRVEGKCSGFSYAR